ncbi:MAG: right-handed parallel beta-helix repeat-containing protein [Ignavibacteriaceae bacterium]
MRKSFLFFRKIFFKKAILIILLFLFCQFSNSAQVVYVDCNTGNDNNNGSIVSPLYSIGKAVKIIQSKNNNIFILKINPGIYVLDKHVPVYTEKEMTGSRIIIEANILPSDSFWTPAKMPVIISAAKKGEFPEFYNFVGAFLINENHVTIRGLKFHGYFYPNTRYFPISRFNKAKSDLLVEQCMFVGDKEASHIQVGIIAHGNEVKIDHCVFYNAKNAVVYWQDSGNGSKTGNSFTNNIVYGAFQTAVWFAWPDNDFLFKNNIITNCRHAFIKNSFNKTKYTIDNSYIVNNQFYQGVADSSGVHPEEFAMDENDITKDGNITLKLPAENADEPLPADYLHVIPGTTGFDIGAGLFKRE